MKAVKVNDGKIIFYCEGCKMNHYVDERWTFNEDFEHPTFTPSVLVKGTERITDEEHDIILSGGKIEPKNFVCHSFVTDGKIEYLSDSTHHLAGKTVELLDEKDWYEEQEEL